MRVMTAFQMGAAPVRPDEFTIGSPLLFPTQTPTATLRVKPIVQLSFTSSVVPVLTDEYTPGVNSGLLLPIAGERAALSASMSLMTKAMRGSSTCRP
jgi:hypothetical protein